MASRILRCPKCGTYTLNPVCESCGIGTHTPHPPRYSPEDRWGRYRRKLKAMSGGD